MKKKLLIVVIGILSLGLGGCASNKNNDSNIEKTDTTQKYRSESFYIEGDLYSAIEYIDNDTRVHYLITIGHYERTVSVTPMYNKDGSLKTSK